MERDSPGEWVPYTQETRNFIVSLAAAGVEKRKRAFLKALHRSGRAATRIFLPASTAKVYHLFIG